MVLIRPEQITIAHGHGEAGLTGRVPEQSYQGHESLITVAPDRHCGPAALQVRVQGTDSYAAGSPVTLTAKGAVPAWPA